MSSAPIKTAVLGMGMSATVFHIPFILSLPHLFKLHTILERAATPEKSAARDRYGSTGFNVVNTLEEVLSDKDVELIVISTPNATHFEYAKAALTARKHVIIEKPLVTSSAEATILIDLAASNNLILATYQNRRWDSDFLTLRKLLDVEKPFGQLSELETRYDRWKPEMKGNGTWKEEAAWGHGAVFDLGSHLIDQVLTLFGTPHTLSAHISNSRCLGPSSFDDSFVAHFFYPPHSPLLPESTIPLIVTIRSASLSAMSPQLRFTVKGTKGSWVKYGLDVQEDQLKLEPPMGTEDELFGVESVQNEGVLTVVDAAAPGGFRKESVKTETGDYISWYKNVGDAIQSRDRNKLIVKPEQARETIRMIELIYQSSKEGKVIIA